MEFVTVRDFRTSSKDVWEKLENDGKLIVTNHGKPQALLLEINEASLEETLDTIRQAEALRLLAKIQRQAVENGTNLLTDEEIEEEISTVRAQHSQKSAVA